MDSSASWNGPQRCFGAQSQSAALFAVYQLFVYNRIGRIAGGWSPLCTASPVSGGILWLDPFYAPVAQWIERLTSNQQVGGSSPSRRAYAEFRLRPGCDGPVVSVDRTGLGRYPAGSKPKAHRIGKAVSRAALAALIFPRTGSQSSVKRATLVGRRSGLCSSASIGRGSLSKAVLL